MQQYIAQLSSNGQDMYTQNNDKRTDTHTERQGARRKRTTGQNGGWVKIQRDRGGEWGHDGLGRVSNGEAGTGRGRLAEGGVRPRGGSNHARSGAGEGCLRGQILLFPSLCVSCVRLCVLASNTAR